MTTADELVAVAASQVGYKATSTSGKYCDWYPMKAYWCQIFVSWCANQSGALNTIIPKSASTVAVRQWFIDRGQWANGKAGIRRGDIIYFKYSRNSAVVNHVGIVESVNSDGSIMTIEGNTSDSSQSTGGTVARKRRTTDIVGYGRPAYAVPAPPAPQAPENETDEDAFIFIDNSGHVLAANGGFVKLGSYEEYRNLKNAGVPEAWVESFTLANLIQDARSH